MSLATPNSKTTVFINTAILARHQKKRSLIDTVGIIALGLAAITFGCTAIPNVLDALTLGGTIGIALSLGSIGTICLIAQKHMQSKEQKALNAFTNLQQQNAHIVETIALLQTPKEVYATHTDAYIEFRDRLKANRDIENALTINEVQSIMDQLQSNATNDTTTQCLCIQRNAWMEEIYSFSQTWYQEIFANLIQISERTKPLIQNKKSEKEIEP